MTNRIRFVLLVVAAASSLSVSGATAQIFTPTYMSPRPSSDLGIYLNEGPGSFAIEGVLRRDFGGYDLGLRGGVADTREVAILIGGEYRNLLAAASPIDIALTAAAQGVLQTEGDSGGAFGVGVSFGHTFPADDLAFTPYLHPRLGFVAGLGRDELDLELLADLGFDVRLTSNVELRFAVTLADVGADWGIGLAWR